MSSADRPAVSALLHDMARAATQSALFNQAVATQLGLSPTDLECLELLEDAGWASAGQLADVTGLTTGAITGLIDRLEQGGYVTRETDPADRRRVIVRPVPGRLVQVHQIEEPLRRALSDTLAAYEDDQLDFLRDFQRRTYQLTQQHTSRLRQDMGRPGSGGRELSAPLPPGIDRGQLEFANGVSQLSVHAGHDLAELYSAAFKGMEPNIRVQGGTVTFRFGRLNLLDWGRFGGSVALNPTIAWAIALRGGASKVQIDGRGLRLRELAIDGGLSNVEVELPSPHGAVPVRIEGGVSKVTIRRPAGAPAEVRISGGASRLQFDGQRFGAVGGEVRLASPGFDLAEGRYEIEVRGGASRLEIKTEEDNEP